MDYFPQKVGDKCIYKIKHFYSGFRDLQRMLYI